MTDPSEPTTDEELYASWHSTMELKQQAEKRCAELEREIKLCRESEEHAKFLAGKAERQLAAVVQAERERCISTLMSVIYSATPGQSVELLYRGCAEIRALAPHAGKEPAVSTAQKIMAETGLGPDTAAPVAAAEWDSSKSVHPDCVGDCQTAAARGPVYLCDGRRSDMLACKESEAVQENGKIGADVDPESEPAPASGPGEQPARVSDTPRTEEWFNKDGNNSNWGGRYQDRMTLAYEHCRELERECASLRADNDEAIHCLAQVADAARTLGPEGCDPVFCIEQAKEQIKSLRAVADAAKAFADHTLFSTPIGNALVVAVREWERGET